MPATAPPAQSDALVIGTAGHIDHGKTTLVRALTGVDLDTLPEERERGITIALGFAPLTLDDGRVVGLVDVPGHERLIRTMVAGASGLDAVMLCVSAVEGVMPQTREHLDILGLLGVESGVLVVTMADAVDAELLELATEEIRDSVRGTFLEHAPYVAVSGLTGAGVPELRRVLAGLARRARPPEGPFRLPVDRSFARRGFGTVVTGTAWSGRVRDGEDLEVQPALAGKALRARLRGVQVHGVKVPEVGAGTRVALNLAGVEVDAVPRGTWLATPGALRPTQVVDARVRWLEDAAGDGERAVVVLHGTAEIEARLVPLEDGLAQLRLAEPLACLPGDRFVLRQASPSRTLGGGQVLDPYFAVARRSRAVEGIPALRRLAAGDAAAWLHRCGTGGMDPSLARQLRVGTEHTVAIADRVYAVDVAAGLRAALLATVAELHAEHPLAPGVNRKQAHRGSLRALDERGFVWLVEQALGAGTLAATASGIRLPNWRVTLGDEHARWTQQVVRTAEQAGWDGAPEPEPHPDREALLHLLRDEGALERIADRYYAPASLRALTDAVRAHLDQHGSLDPAAFKELTGQSRRTAIPLLEWLDEQGVTQRRGDVRVRKGA